MRLRSVLLVVVVAVVVAATTVALVSRKGSSDTVDLSSSSASTVGTTEEGRAPTSSSSTSTTIVPGPYTTPNMPVTVKAPSTGTLRDGSSITIHVDPNQGSQLYGVDARLCRGDAPVRNDGEFVPTQGGICSPVALSPNSDARVTVEGRPPYGGLDLVFRVGSGSTSFKMQSGVSSSVTCDSTHPCQIVLKLQYPNGFGFQSVPITLS